MKKRIAIVVDGYKLKTYLKELEKENFNEVGHAPFLHNMSSIQIHADESRVEDIKKLCERLEEKYKKDKLKELFRRKNN